MKRLLFISFFLLSAGISHAEYYQFIDGFEDVPLMKGLAQMQDGITSFDSTEGSFVEVHLYAEPKIKSDRVFKYYGEVLPALGWKNAQQANCFKRESDNLCISFEPYNDNGQESGEVIFELKR